MDEVFDKRRAMDKRLSTFNGVIYIGLFAALIVELFTSSFSVMQTFYGIACCVMFVLLLYSYRRIAVLINSLHYKGLHTADTTIAVQLICLALASCLNVSELVTSILYNRQCKDDITEVSTAGVVGIIFEFIIVVLWRIITVTMVIFFLK